jgi:hypothetical protein
VLEGFGHLSREFGRDIQLGKLTLYQLSYTRRENPKQLPI